MIRRAVKIAIPLGLVVALVVGWNVRTWWNERPPELDVDHRTTTKAVTALSKRPPAMGETREVWRTKVGHGRYLDPYALHLTAGQVVVEDRDGVQAYDARSGRPRWHYRIDDGPPMDVAVTDNGMVVLIVGDNSSTSRRNRIVGLDAATGRIRWERSEHWEPKADNKSGFIHDSGSVFVNTPDNERVLAIDARTGDERWSLHGQACSDGYLLLEDGSTDGSLLLAHKCGADWDNGSVYGLDPATGKVRWESTAIASGDVGEYLVDDGVALLVPTETGSVTPSDTYTLIARSGRTAAEGTGSVDRMRRVGNHAILTEIQQRDTASTAVDLRSGDSEPLADWPSGPVTVVGSRAFALDPFLFDREINGIDGLHARLARFDSATGKIVHAPVLLRDAPRVLPYAIGGGRLFVLAGQYVPGPLELRSYSTAPADAPVELGGTPYEDWPDPCALLSRRPGVEPVRQSVSIGGRRLLKTSCSVRLENRTASVAIAWVFPKGRRLDRVFGAHSIPGEADADEANRTDSGGLRVGQVVLRARVMPTDRKEPLAGEAEQIAFQKAVVKRLRELQNDEEPLRSER